MKKSLLMILAAAAVFAACQKEVNAPEKELEETPEIVQPAAPKVIYADIDSDETKAGMDRYYDDGTSSYKYRHHWDLNDLIYVYEGTTRTTYKCTNVSTGEFTQEGLADDIPGGYRFSKVCGVFSTIGYNDATPSVIENDKVSVRNNNGYNLASSTPGYANFMTAISDDGEHFHFTSQVGWLKLQLQGYGTITGMTLWNGVSSVNPMYPLDECAGSLLFDFSTGTYSFAYIDDLQLTVDLPEPLVLDPSTPKDLYFALPPMTYHGLNLDVNNSTGTNFTLTTLKYVTITANAVTPMAVKSVGYLNATLVGGQAFNAALKTLAAGSSKAYTDADDLIKGITLSKSEATPTDTGTNVSATAEYPIYASFDDGTGIVTLHTRSNTISLNEDCRYMFSNMSELTSIEMLSQINTSIVGRFNDATAGPKYMFNGCAKLASIDLSKVRTLQPESFEAMFKGCAALTSIDLSTLASTSAKSVADMFNGCSSLNAINLTPIGTQASTTFARMFAGCSSLTSLDVSMLRTTLGTKFNSMFEGCSNLSDLNLGSGFFCNPAVDNLMSMFQDCSSLTSIHLTRGIYSGETYGDLTETVGYPAPFALICSGCTNLVSFVCDLTGLGGNFTSAFSGCVKLETIDLSRVSDNASVAKYWNSCFNNCYKLSTLKLNSAHFSGSNTLTYMFTNTSRDAASLDLYIYNSAAYDTIKGGLSDHAKSIINLHYTN